MSSIFRGPDVQDIIDKLPYLKEHELADAADFALDLYDMDRERGLYIIDKILEAAREKHKGTFDYVVRIIMHAAIDDKEYKLIEKVLQHGVDINTANLSQTAFASVAITNLDVRMVKLFLKYGQIHQNVQNNMLEYLDYVQRRPGEFPEEKREKAQQIEELIS